MNETPAGPQFPGPAGQTGTGGADVALGKGSSPLVPHWPDAPAEPPPCGCEKYEPESRGDGE
jgi:hypothetical protein